MQPAVYYKSLLLTTLDSLPRLFCDARRAEPHRDIEEVHLDLIGRVRDAACESMARIEQNPPKEFRASNHACAPSLSSELAP